MEYYIILSALTILQLLSRPQICMSQSYGIVFVKYNVVKLSFVLEVYGVEKRLSVPAGKKNKIIFNASL